MQADPKDRGAISGALFGPLFLAGIVGAIRLAKQPIPRPGSPGSQVRTYYTESSRAVRYSSALQLVSALLLARFAQSATRLAAGSGDRRLGAGAAVSGGLAVASAAASALTHASLAGDRRDSDEGLARRSRRVFVIGGPLHGVAFGVFTAVLSRAARNTGVLGRTGSTAGLLTGAAGVASPLYFAREEAGWLIPIGRFGGYAVSAVVGARLAGRR